MQIIYEPHPVSPERKAELRAEGYRIIDARFAPAEPEDEADDSDDESETEVEPEGKAEAEAEPDLTVIGGIVGECGGPDIDLPQPKTARKTK